MELNEAIDKLKELGFLVEETKFRNNMIRGGKPTNLYRAARCCLRNNNNPRSRDLLDDYVVTNWHNLTPLMCTQSKDGQSYFSHRWGPGNASYWSLTPFGYEMYKAAAEQFGDNVYPYKEPPMDKETILSKIKEKGDAFSNLLSKISTVYEAEGPQALLIEKLDEAKTMMQELVELKSKIKNESTEI